MSEPISALVPAVDLQPRKAMLRVYSGAQKGATAFFRNRPLLQTLDELLRSNRAPTLRVLFHAASIGAEPYSFVIHGMLSGLSERVILQVHATDINAEFLAHARAGFYPAAAIETLTPAERAFFEPIDAATVRVCERVRKRVSFLPPCSFVDADFPQSFDLVFVLNALTYVTPAQQHEALLRIAGYNSEWLVMAAFHPDSVRGDLQAAGYVAVPDRIADIHNGWDERIRDADLPPPDSPDYSWVIPPFAAVPGHEYRFGSIFRKHADRGPATR